MNFFGPYFNIHVYLSPGPHNGHIAYPRGYAAGVKASDSLKEKCKNSRTTVPTLYTETLAQATKSGMPLDENVTVCFKKYENVKKSKKWSLMMKQKQSHFHFCFKPYTK